MHTYANTGRGGTNARSLSTWLIMPRYTPRERESGEISREVVWWNDSRQGPSRSKKNPERGRCAWLVRASASKLDCAQILFPRNEIHKQVEELIICEEQALNSWDFKDSRRFTFLDCKSWAQSTLEANLSSRLFFFQFLFTFRCVNARAFEQAHKKRKNVRKTTFCGAGFFFFFQESLDSTEKWSLKDEEFWAYFCKENIKNWQIQEDNHIW